MFNKLKLQFIFTNIAIVFSLFFLITIGVYFLLQTNLRSHAEFFSKKLADGINSGIIPDLPQHYGHLPKQELGLNPGMLRKLPPHDGHMPESEDRIDSGMLGGEPPQDIPMPNVFFVKTDPTGVVFFQSARQPFDPNQLTKLVKERLKATKISGIIKFLHTKYFYYKTSLRDQPGMLIIFQDFDPERNILHSLILSLIIVGIFCLTLSLCGSLYMANRAIIPIQQAWQQQKNFIADASHELRTPLTIIRTNLEIVLSNQNETVANQNDWLISVKEEAQHMTDLVASLLFLARADSNQLLLEKRYFSLNEVTFQVAEAFKPIAATKDIDLQMLTKTEITGYGDESRIRQVIEILLDNAIRHTPPSGKISINLDELDKEILLTVTDTGEGIAPEHLDKIFDRFYQVDNSRSKGELGLGLSIAKCIIENHGGIINVVSVLGSGTRFTIELPLPKNNNNHFSNI
jgi:two-component system, OmpR family, sensor histidine kinase CiaH